MGRTFRHLAQAVCQFRTIPPHGGRHGWSQVVSYDKVFQSTPPHGGRLKASDELFDE